MLKKSLKKKIQMNLSCFTCDGTLTVFGLFFQRQEKMHKHGTPVCNVSITYLAEISHGNKASPWALPSPGPPHWVGEQHDFIRPHPTGEQVVSEERKFLVRKEERSWFAGHGVWRQEQTL